jgi:hypothetical protein
MAPMVIGLRQTRVTRMLLGPNGRLGPVGSRQGHAYACLLTFRAGLRGIGDCAPVDL